MRHSFSVFILAMAAVVAGALPAHAGFLYVEGVSDPELSDDRLAPTPLTAGLTVSVGSDSNFLLGFVSTFGGVTDLDYFTVFIPDGLQLDQLILRSFTGTNVAFIGLASGTIFPTPASAPDPALIQGYVHFGLEDLDTNLLLVMPTGGNPPGGPPPAGFTAPLPSGFYTFWVQETADFVNYQFEFVVSEAPPTEPPTTIPEPLSLGLAGLGGALALGYARRQRHRTTFAPAR